MVWNCVGESNNFVDISWAHIRKVTLCQIVRNTIEKKIYRFPSMSNKLKPKCSSVFEKLYHRGKPTDKFQGGSLVRNVKRDEIISQQNINSKPGR